MSPLSDALASHFTFPASRFAFCFLFGAASIGVSFWKSVNSSLQPDKPGILPSAQEESSSLPYPPDALPGARDVDSPYGSIRVYEWGPEDGPRVLLVHGISTPSIALGGLACNLVGKGCRVMLFDLYGRGYSSSPDPNVYRYDSALYISQILLCLQSSPINWRPFTIIGYSLGGAIGADFASYFPHLISGLFLIAPGGLIRRQHVTWKSKLLYSTSGLIPEWLINELVAKRLWTGPETARSIEPESDTATEAQREAKGGLRSQAVYASSHRRLLPANPNSTVGNVVDWQIQHQEGFVPAFISSIRYAPIHDQQHRWRRIGEYLRQAGGCASGASTARLKEVHLILGEDDPIIIADEVVEDAKAVLGSEFVRVKIINGVGHEVAIEKADEIANLVYPCLAPTTIEAEAKKAIPANPGKQAKPTISKIEDRTTSSPSSPHPRTPATPIKRMNSEARKLSHSRTHSGKSVDSKEKDAVKDGGSIKRRAESTSEQQQRDSNYSFKARRLFETDSGL